jgi:agmatine/peptidylarginine deiminase
LAEALRSIGVEPFLLKAENDPLDIWIRDWGFLEGAYFRFAPSYAKQLYPQSEVQTARAEFDRQTGIQHPSIPLILDGGNLVHDGNTAIVTEKVLFDNR